MHQKANKGKKILLITYYWPPAGGPGVQRWVKLVKYMSRLGAKIDVLTVEVKDASFPYHDESFVKDVSAGISVYRTRAFNPIHKFQKLTKSSVNQYGIESKNAQSFKQKILAFIRSNFFVPDPRRGWNRYAIPKAEQLIQQHQYEVLITSSPPHSTHLIGKRLKAKYPSLFWVSDFRDPWTDMYTFDSLGLLWIIKWIHRSLERRVLSTADLILTVSAGCKQFFKDKVSRPERDFHIIHNGFDPEDYASKELKQKDDSIFRILYTGKVNDQFKIDNLLAAINDLGSTIQERKIELHFVGYVSQVIKELINNCEQLKEHVKYWGFVSHNEAVRHQFKADVLLLFIPLDSPQVLTGKLFEYIATGKPILCVGQGEAADIIEQCGLGKGFSRAQRAEMRDFIMAALEGKLGFHANQEVINQYSRKYQAQKIIELL